MARPSKYETHVKPKLNIIAGWMRKGLTIAQVAERLGVAPSTMFEYQVKYSELRDTLKSNAEEADAEVENALYKSAMGFEYEETKITMDTDGKKRIEKTKKYYPPNQTAMIFWLKNRQPKAWRDKQHIFQASSTTIRKDYEHLTDEELENEMNILESVVPSEDNESEGEVH